MYIWKTKSRINRRNNINQRYYYNKYFNVSKAIIYITTTLFILLINSVHNVKSWPVSKGGWDVITKDSKIKTTERGAHSPERIPEMEETVLAYLKTVPTICLSARFAFKSWS